MAKENQAPEFVYRLATQGEWITAQAGHVVPFRDIDKRDGYFHLSTHEQVLETARLHFAGEKNLLALEIPIAKISDRIKFELAQKRGEYFPHYYGSLTIDHVSRVFKLMPAGEGFSLGEEV